MSNFHSLDSVLRKQAPDRTGTQISEPYIYAQSMAAIENVVAVVSDLSQGTSRIYNGGFAEILGIENYSSENSIWEKKILSLMTPQEQEQKFIAELRFFHHLKHLAPAHRNHYLMSKLHMRSHSGNIISVLHRMYYIYHPHSNIVRYAICLYGPLSVDFKGRSMIVNSLSGVCEELTSLTDPGILSRRERQVLSLIDSGMKSRDVARHLNISIHTVSRHRQEILAKLQVKNSIEACRLAKSMALI